MHETYNCCVSVLVQVCVLFLLPFWPLLYSMPGSFLSAYVAHPLSLSPCLSPPLCPWGPSPFILTPRAITISVVTAGHVTCTCSSGWSPHAEAIWSHVRTRTNTHTGSSWLPSPRLPPSFFTASLLFSRSITSDSLLSSSLHSSDDCPLPARSLFQSTLFPSICSTFTMITSEHQQVLAWLH